MTAVQLKWSLFYLYIMFLTCNSNKNINYKNINDYNNKAPIIVGLTNFTLTL